MAHRIQDDVADVLRKSKTEGNTLLLPIKLDMKLYAKVKKVLEISGFIWNRKAQCHIAQNGKAAETLATALDDGQIVDPKNEWDFFQTPEDLADRMATILDIQPFERVLEPSAGGGRLVCATIRKGAGRQFVFAIEAQPDLRNELKAICNVYSGENDFLEFHTDHAFDKIIANFPFSNFQDITHCRHAYDLLKPGGRMVCITGPSWQFRTDKKSVAFKEWFENLPDVTVEELPAGTFKDSGTNVRSLLLIINKEK